MGGKGNIGSWICSYCRAFNSSLTPDFCPVCGNHAEAGYSGADQNLHHSEPASVVPDAIKHNASSGPGAGGTQNALEGGTVDPEAVDAIFEGDLDAINEAEVGIADQKESNNGRGIGGDIGDLSINESYASDSSARDDVWSDASSFTSGTSFGALAYYGGHEHVLQAYIELIFEDADIHRLLTMAINMRTAEDRLQRRLHRLLRLLGLDLRAESTTVEQRRMAKFIAYQSRTAASAILRQMDGYEATVGRNTGAKDTTSSSGDDSQSEDEDPVDEDEENDLARAKRFVVESKAFDKLRQSLHVLVFPTLSSLLGEYIEKSSKRLDDDTEEKWMQAGRALAQDLYEAHLASVNITESVHCSILESMQKGIEVLTDQSWDWWPLKPPRPSGLLERDYVYLSWNCRCGHEMVRAVPENLARQAEVFAKQMASTTGSSTSSSNLQPPPLVSQRTAVGAPSPLQQGSGSTSAPGLQRPQGSQIHPNSVQSNGSTVPNQNGWVLVVVQSFNEYHIAQINVHQLTTDDFFRQLRSEYFKLRGRMTRYFSVWCYSHCDFYKFQLWDDDTAVPRKGHEYPDPSDPHYDYKPKPMADIPPISKHEFKKRHEGCSQRRFHLRCNKQCPCVKAKARAHNRDVVDLLPKKIYQLDIKANQRSNFWGLYARQEISFLRVLVYNAVCISPFIWFFFMWLYAWGHSGDQQNASVPLMAMLTFLSIFWATFIASLRQNRDGDIA